MKVRLVLVSFLMLPALAAIAQAANEQNADSLRKFCEPFRSSSAPSLDKAYCRGYIVGWRAGIEGAQIPDDKGVLQIVTFAAGATDGDMARQFLLYMDNHADEKDALPKIALMHAMLSAGIAKTAPAEKAPDKPDSR